MNICFIICGLPRCIELTLFNIEKKFYNYNINYFICLTKNHLEYEKEYVNTFNLNTIINNIKIIKILLMQDTFDNSFRNSINYINKINNIINIIDSHYDMYIVIRSDLSFEDINFIDLITDQKTIYFNETNFNTFIKSTTTKINDNIIISKDYNLLKILFNGIYNNLLNINNYLEIELYNYINLNNIPIKLININYKLILSKCNIIAIAGDSGSGKTTLSNYLLKIFNNNDYCRIETDRYHKWERGDVHYQTYSHLNPYANYLEKMNDDIYKLKIGHEIYAVDYDHNSGKFTQEEKIVSKNNVILCGLHTLYNDNTNNILDLKIFLDTDRVLIKNWKINRDVNERGYSIEKVLKQIENREHDYNEYIKNQKENADIIIRFYESGGKINCNIKLNKRLSTYSNFIELKKNNFDIISNEKTITIKLKDTIEYIKSNMLESINLPNNFYGEICLLVGILIKLN